MTKTQTVERLDLGLSTDEIEDIRFCLGLVALQNEDKMCGDLPEIRMRSLAEQAERFRALARKISG